MISSGFHLQRVPSIRCVGMIILAAEDSICHEKLFPCLAIASCVLTLRSALRSVVFLHPCTLSCIDQWRSLSPTFTYEILDVIIMRLFCHSELFFVLVRYNTTN